MGCITRKLYRHYRGFADGQYKLLSSASPTVKQLLYAYRVLLTGIHVLKSGEIEANLFALSQSHPVPGLEELIQRKLQGAEKGMLKGDELKSHEAPLAGLDSEMEDAFTASRLPDAPTTFDALDDFVVRARLALVPCV